MICLPDFDGDDFEDLDFSTSSWLKNINDYLFKLLPDYFKQNDSYKNNFNKGILERYMDIFGNELDAWVVPYIECVMDINNPQVAQEKFLDHISDSWGSPSDLFLSTDRYRNQLKTILSLHKSKGTLGQVTNMFYLFGYDLVIERIPTDSTYYYYDTEANYDEGGVYDTFGCLPCWRYTATIEQNSNHDASSPDATDNTIFEKLKSLLTEEQPINAELVSFTLI